MDKKFTTEKMKKMCKVCKVLTVMSREDNNITRKWQ
jgi:hypothetical protein